MDAHLQGAFRILRLLRDATQLDAHGAEVGVILEFLLRNLEALFTAEETTLCQSGYPDFLPHHRAHRRLMHRGYELKWQFESGSSPITPAMVLALMEDLQQHVHQMDLPFASFYISQTDGLALDEFAG